MNTRRTHATINVGPIALRRAAQRPVDVALRRDAAIALLLRVFIQRASFRARFKILRLLRMRAQVMQRFLGRGEGTGKRK
jgi:hypothetical protein